MDLTSRETRRAPDRSFLRHRRLVVAASAIVILSSVCGGRTQELAPQSQSSSVSQESGDVFAELARDTIRPSRLSGGQLLQGVLPPVAVSASDTAQRLQLETGLWQLELQKATGLLRLLNKQSGAQWELGPSQLHPAGIWWEVTDDKENPSATLNLTEVEQVRKDGNRWIVQGKTGNSP